MNTGGEDARRMGKGRFAARICVEAANASRWPRARDDIPPATRMGYDFGKISVLYDFSYSYSVKNYYCQIWLALPDQMHLISSPS